MKVRRSLNCRVGKVPFGLVSRTVVLIEGIIVGWNPNVGLVTEAEANCCRAGFGGVRRRGSQRRHDIGQDMGKAEVETWPQMLRGLVIDPMEEVTIDRMSVKFRVTRHLPSKIRKKLRLHQAKNLVSKWHADFKDRFIVLRLIETRSLRLLPSFLPPP